MKLGFISHVPDVKGFFGPEVGDRVILNLTQGPHGRAFCGERVFDLPDPLHQPTTVVNPRAQLEIVGFHGAPSSIGNIEVAALKLRGDVQIPVVRAMRLTLSHGWLQANEISGPKSALTDDIQTIQEIRLQDSRLTCHGELNFANLVSDDFSESFVQASYLEGWTAQGRLFLKAGHLVIGVLEAEEVVVAEPEGCRIAQIYCDRVFQQRGLGTRVPVEPIRDRDLTTFITGITAIEDHHEIAAGFDLD